METPKKRSVRTDTPRVLTRTPAQSPPTGVRQRPPRVVFTTVRSAPAVAATAATKKHEATARAPSVSHARMAATSSGASRPHPSGHHPTTRTTRSSSCGRGEGGAPAARVAPPPPLQRPPSTPAEVNHFVERMDYEQQLLEAYQQAELRRRGLNATSLPPSRPPSRCGSVDSRSMRRARPATANPPQPHRRRLDLASPTGARPAPLATRRAATKAQGSVAPRKGPLTSSSSAADGTVPSRGPAKVSLLRPGSVCLGGPTATHAAAKRSAALRPSTVPVTKSPAHERAVAAACRASSSLPGRAAHSRPVISGSPSDQTVNGSGSPSRAEPSSGNVTSPYEGQLEARRGGSPSTQPVRKPARLKTAPSAHKRPTLHAVAEPPVAGPSQPRSRDPARRTSSDTSTSSLTFGATVPHAVPAGASGSVDVAPLKKSKRKAPALKIRHASVPPGLGRPAHTAPLRGQDDPVSATELSSTSFGSVGSSTGVSETCGDPSPYSQNVYVPRLCLPAPDSLH